MEDEYPFDAEIIICINDRTKYNLSIIQNFDEITQSPLFQGIFFCLEMKEKIKTNIDRTNRRKKEWVSQLQ